MESTEEFGALFAEFLRRVVREAPEPRSPLADRLAAHLGSDPLGAPLLSARFAPFEHPDLQQALDAYLAERDHEVLGLGGPGGMSFGDVLAHVRSPLGAPSYAERPVDVDGQLPCLASGVALVTDAHGPHAVVVTTEDRGPFESLTVTVVALDRDHGRAVLEELRRLMTVHSVYRGKVLTLDPGTDFPGESAAGATFLAREPLDRDAIVLPDGVLDRVERRTAGFDRVAGALAAQGLSRKRGLLLYGPPGTGKTLTVRYLIGSMPERTVVVLTGRGLGAIRPAGALARRLAPAMLVLEDVDLVGFDRSFGPEGNPVLFELLNTLDGLGEDDADIIVVLTTNRPDLLEPALAARPGRVDLAVELPLPGEEERARLLERATATVSHDVQDWSSTVERTAGTPASFIGELVRSAALLAAERGVERLTAEDVDAALDELLDSGPLTAALLGARWSPDDGDEVLGPGPPWMGPGEPRGTIVFDDGVYGDDGP